MILSDFICPIHGRFEALADRDADSAPCPADMPIAVDGHITRFSSPCEFPSPWTPSPVAGRVELVSAVSRGKWEPPPSKLATNTRPLMEGQKYSEWRKERKKVWRDHDWKQRKERG